MDRHTVALDYAATPVVVIPDRVTNLGPQLSRLPDELIHHLFSIIVARMFPATSGFYKRVDARAFDILNRYGAVKKIRGVSPAFKTFFMEALYETFPFVFNFKYEAIIPKSVYLTRLPPKVPAVHLRHHLRRIHLDLVLETYYYKRPIPLELARETDRYHSVRKIVTANQMLTFCPAACFLLFMTSDQYGFCHLTSLHLNISVNDDFHKISDEFLAVLDTINFTVKARRVELKVSDTCGSVYEQHMEVKKRIRVVS